jgi:hypothetical protein
MRIEPISGWILSYPPRVDHEYRVLLDVTTGNKYNIKIYQCHVYTPPKWVLHFPPITSIKDIYQTFNKGSSDNYFDTLKEAEDKADFVLNRYKKLKAFM